MCNVQFLISYYNQSMNIYITRHGQTDWNTLWRLQGRTDIELNENGIEQAKKTAIGLKNAQISFDRVYSSPLKRALKTAQLISGFPEDKIIKDDRIIEIAFGKAEGTTPDERKSILELKDFNNFFEAPEKYIAKDNAESFDSVFARVNDFWENEIKSLEKQNIQNVLVTTHGGALQALLLHIDGRKLSEYWKVKFPNCSMNLVSLNNGNFKMEWNSKVFY